MFGDLFSENLMGIIFSSKPHLVFCGIPVIVNNRVIEVSTGMTKLPSGCLITFYGKSRIVVNTTAVSDMDVLMAIVGHEYGHLTLGHNRGKADEMQAVRRANGDDAAIQKELDADRVGAEINLPGMLRCLRLISAAVGGSRELSIRIRALENL